MVNANKVPIFRRGGLKAISTEKLRFKHKKKRRTGHAMDNVYIRGRFETKMPPKHEPRSN
ncbi:MAG: hypothetical protein D6714_05145 [Bacteroidetes bacterium]|nr:MAG: hypothetical protein D6714_05145 [Bacteroidota bacterium]